METGLLDSLPEALAQRRVACAESCTAGRVAAELAAVGDAVHWFAGGLVAYQTGVKRSLLGVEAPSVVTAEAAEEMAHGVIGLLGADVAIATTGVLGDDAVDGVPGGTVFVSTVVDGVARTRRHHVRGSPAERCDRVVGLACEQLAAHLSDAG